MVPDAIHLVQNNCEDGMAIATTCMVHAPSLVGEGTSRWISSVRYFLKMRKKYWLLWLSAGPGLLELHAELVMNTRSFMADVVELDELWLVKAR